jgi:hypothetical protein
MPKYTHRLLTSSTGYGPAIFILTPKKLFVLILYDIFEVTKRAFFKAFESCGSYLFSLSDSIVQIQELWR